MNVDRIYWQPGGGDCYADLRWVYTCLLVVEGVSAIRCRRDTGITPTGAKKTFAKNRQKLYNEEN
jgi:hypothetical protein